LGREPADGVAAMATPRDEPGYKSAESRDPGRPPRRRPDGRGLDGHERECQGVGANGESPDAYGIPGTWISPPASP